MDDSSFCQQMQYPCTAEYYTFISLFDNLGSVNPLGPNIELLRNALCLN